MKWFVLKDQQIIKNKKINANWLMIEIIYHFYFQVLFIGYDFAAVKNHGVEYKSNTEQWHPSVNYTGANES
jgi:hypothetical protein